MELASAAFELKAGIAYTYVLRELWSDVSDVTIQDFLKSLNFN
jgi:hypothetical protein